MVTVTCARRALSLSFSLSLSRPNATLIQCLAFTCPCIASISLKYNQQDATFSRSIYFYKLLYMFHAVPPTIIRSTKLYIHCQVLSNQYCCLLLSWMRWNSMEFHLIHDSSSIGLTIPDAVCTVLCS